MTKYICLQIFQHYEEIEDIEVAGVFDKQSDAYEHTLHLEEKQRQSIYDVRDYIDAYVSILKYPETCTLQEWSEFVTKIGFPQMMRYQATFKERIKEHLIQCNKSPFASTSDMPKYDPPESYCYNRYFQTWIKEIEV